MATTRQFKTNLNCKSCVAAVTPFLDAIPDLSDWNVETDTPDKTLTVEGDGISPETVIAAVAKAGFVATSHTDPATIPPSESKDDNFTYFPLILLGTFLLGVVVLVEVRVGTFDATRAMQNFMGAFFAAFAFFKLLDLRGFADSYRMYDLVAQRLPVYGYVYPFIELSLGAAYIAGLHPTAVNLTTLIVMSVSSLGVIQSVRQKRKIRCACLGTVFNLPMSTVTLIEDGLMIAMAAAALLGVGHGTEF